MDLKNKNCAILAHGKSIEELEKRIQEFKDLNVVWCGMNYFNPTEEVLKLINKEFKVVFDCSTVKNNVEYELKGRLPRLREYLDRNTDNIYITLRTGRDNLFDLRNRISPEFNSKYQEKIIYGEDLGFDTNQFCVSLHLYITILYKMGAKKIFLFGADGGGSGGNNVDSYFQAEIINKDKVLADNVSYNMVGDTNNINSTYEPIMKNIFGYVPIVLNCSPNSTYTAFKKCTYDETLQILRSEYGI
jgi:hypothetical protein